MKYEEHYARLIDRAKTRSLEEYSENHHILPKCLGGTDDLINLVRLTPREHFVAHQLLVKMYPSNYSLIHAAHMMTLVGKQKVRSNRLYGWLRERVSNSAKQRIGSKNGSFGKKWYHNEKTLESGKFSECPVGWKIGRVPNTKCCVCGSDTGTHQREYCDIHRPKRLSPFQRGHKRTQDTNQKLRQYCKKRKKEEHPQFGKRWVNNGVVNFMVSKDQLEEYLMNGWYKGKTKRTSN